MCELQDIVGYIYKQYPYKGELSKGRITKLVYLVDWTMCLMAHVQVSKLRWFFNQYGPYSEEIEHLIRSNDLFTYQDTDNYYGGNKKSIKLKYEDEFDPVIPDAQKNVIDATIKKTQDITWQEFTNMVSRTYPLVTQTQYQYLNLPELAQQYVKKIKSTS
jgi:uncharacterized protein YwgA